MKRVSIDIKKNQNVDIYKILAAAITPRPIAFVSTKNKMGISNLSPYSFFNAFSVDPPVVVFSPTGKPKGKDQKDTLSNIIETKECVIGIVNTKIVQQISLTSCEYPSGVNEFEKAGLTEVKADLVNASLIGESNINMECRLVKVIPLGEKSSSGNLVLCEVLKFHVNEKIMNQNFEIDPKKLDAVSRHGGNFYGKTTEDSIFEIPKPKAKIGMGFDKLPEKIRTSSVLSGNELAILASYEDIPKKNPDFVCNLTSLQTHEEAKKLINMSQVDLAWQYLIHD